MEGWAVARDYVLGNVMGTGSVLATSLRYLKGKAKGLPKREARNWVWAGGAASLAPPTRW